MTQLLRGGHTATDPRLGRVPEFDPISWDYPVRGLLARVVGDAKPPLRSFTWQVGPVLDQKQTGHCVGFGTGARVMAVPDRHREVDNAWCHDLYHRAQQLDEWEGEEPAYEGTSVLAGAKAATERGYFSQYRWAFGADDVLRAIGYLGPVILGTVWLEGMFKARPSGLLEVDGDVAGGHCYLARGVRLRARLPGEGLKPIEVVRIRNSWGDWALAGDAYIKVEDLQRLLQDDGDACVPVEPRQHRTEV